MDPINKIKAAINRLDFYGAPADSSPVMIDSDNTLYEMLDRSEGLGDNMEGAKQITLGDLRQLMEVLMK